MKQVMLDLGSSPYKKHFQQWIPTNTAATFSAIGVTPMQSSPVIYKPLETSEQQERFKELQQQIIDICGEDIVLG